MPRRSPEVNITRSEQYKSKIQISASPRYDEMSAFNVLLMNCRNSLQEVQSITRTRISLALESYGYSLLEIKKLLQEYSVLTRSLSRMIFGYTHSGHRLLSILDKYRPSNEFLSYEFLCWQRGHLHDFESNIQYMFK